MPQKWIGAKKKLDPCDHVDVTPPYRPGDTLNISIEKKKEEVDQLSYKRQSSVKLRMCSKRRLDTRRAGGHSVNPLAKVCANLPEDCFESAFLKDYDPLEKLGLGILPSSARLDDALTAIAQLLL